MASKIVKRSMIHVFREITIVNYKKKIFKYYYVNLSNLTIASEDQKIRLIAKKHADNKGDLT